MINIWNINNWSPLFLLDWLSIYLILNGLMGFIFMRRNLIIMLMCIELLLVGLTILFLVNGAMFDDLLGQIMTLFILTVAAAESAIGLSILVVYFRLRGLLYIDKLNYLKG